jgi:hypothetical protein
MQQTPEFGTASDRTLPTLTRFVTRTTGRVGTGFTVDKALVVKDFVLLLNQR